VESEKWKVESGKGSSLSHLSLLTDVDSSISESQSRAAPAGMLRGDRAECSGGKYLDHALERILLAMRPRWPSRRYLNQLFPPSRIFGFVLAAFALTFSTTLIPRPVYGSGLQTIGFGYPMPYLNLRLEPAILEPATLEPATLDTEPPVQAVRFVAWWGGPIALEWGLAALNVAFFLAAFAWFRVAFPPRSLPAPGLPPKSPPEP
jgi:hypothetical protein